MKAANLCCLLFFYLHTANYIVEQFHKRSNGASVNKMRCSMDKIMNSVFKSMTVHEVTEFVSIWENSGIEFWDLVDLYYIGE